MATKRASFKQYLNTPTSILPLAIFRIAFGILMLYSTVRFIRKGWVKELYIDPPFHFTYYGFSFIQPLPGDGMYFVFGALVCLTVMIILGLGYRVAVITFFLLFTYVELLDKAYYLNHYYFVSLLSFVLIFLPMNRKWALDSWFFPQLRQNWTPRWTIKIIQLQLGLVYFLAGVAKLNHDWLFGAQPLQIWLRAHTDFPIIGRYFITDWFPYIMSWAGAFYDLTIVGWLLWRRTRWLAYGAVLGFHIMTDLLFQIGVFPWVMIACTLIFFTTEDYRVVFSWFKRADWLKLSTPPETQSMHWQLPRWGLVLFTLFFVTQVGISFRHYLYPGNTLWTQEGFRYGWRVMLVESSGYSVFKVHDPATERTWYVYPDDYLTQFQENQMNFQPDMILEFAHYLEDQYRQQGHADVEIRVETYVRFNGRSSRLLIAPTVDLTQYPRQSLKHQPWIITYDDY